MAKPKLCLIPSAQGDKFYSVLPSSGVGDFDFTRSGSATRINSQGLIETVGNGVSRLNYPLIDGKVVGCPSHLLENSATNLITYSEDFSQSVWTKNLSSITSDNAISPNGSIDASKFISSNDGLNSRIEVLPTLADNTVYTLSIFVKKGDLNFISINLRDKTGVTRVAYFDINNGVLTSTINSPQDANIEYFGNGWFRVSITVNSLSGVTTPRAQYVLASADGDVDTGLNTFLYIWGAMLEQGSHSTSYIKSNGSATTRSAETANNSGDAATFNDSEGVLMVEGNIPKDENVFRNISISDGSSNNFVTFYTTDTLNKITYLLGAGGQGAVFGLDYFFQDITIPFKIALVYSSGRNEIWVNGIKVKQNSNTFNLMSGLNELSFDNGTGSGNWYGNTKQVQYYDSALTDSELETLTSWVSFSDMANGQQYIIE